ncbi:MAG: methionyl-tRNA formyltransferase [Actinobacteria bacterium]|nr:methionyl-tRNA formyltransferase [Actinomycetota bacterium]
MKIIFAGTPEVAIPTLEALNARHEVVGVITRPDAPLGRKRILTPSSVAQRATQLGLAVHKTSRFTQETSDFIAQSGAELGVVVAYGALIPEHDLAAVAHGWINLHFSQLPQWRGAAPLQRTIMSGATEVGLSIFTLVAELDAGPVLESMSVPLGATETAGEALTRLATVGSHEIVRVVESIETGIATSTEQVGQVSFAGKLTANDGRLEPKDTARSAFNIFRGVTPEPGAWIDSTTGRVKILECTMAEAGSVSPGAVLASPESVLLGFNDGSLSLITVQPAGKISMPAHDWARGLQREQWSFS